MCCLSNLRFGRCNIQSAIVRAMDSMLDDLEAYRSLKSMSTCNVEMDEETKSLIDAGFTNHKKVVDYYKRLEAAEDSVNSDSKYRQQLNKSCDYIACLVAARKTFGRNTMFLPVDTFMSIINDYGVKCQLLSEYDKDISEKKLREITRIREQEAKYPGTIIPVCRVTSVERRYYSWGEEEYNEIRNKVKRCNLVKGLEPGWIKKRLIYLNNDYSLVDDTNVSITEKSKFFLFQPNNIFRHDGPFFCAFNGMGILIFMRPTETGGRRAFKRLMYFNQRLESLCFEETPVKNKAKNKESDKVDKVLSLYYDYWAIKY